MQVWSPRLGSSAGGGHGNPLQCSCLGSPIDRGAWQATVCGVTESDTTEWLTHTYTDTHTPPKPPLRTARADIFSVTVFLQKSSDGDQEGAVTVSSLVNKVMEWLLDDSTIRVYFLLLHLGTFWTFSLEVICFDLKCTLPLRVKTPSQKQGFGHCMFSFKTIYLSFQQVAI